jgi:hypothetical protein
MVARMVQIATGPRMTKITHDKTAAAARVGLGSPSLGTDSRGASSLSCGIAVVRRVGLKALLSGQIGMTAIARQEIVANQCCCQ